MTNLNRPKKNPDMVRHRLLQSTASLMTTHGFAGVSIDKVATEAGVTKGALFHHFPNKKALIEAVFDRELAMLDKLLDDLLDKDTGDYGRFTRAYIHATFFACIDDRLSSALTFSLCARPELVERWDVWMAGRMVKHQKTDNSLQLEVARMAADGIWFTHLLHGGKLTAKKDLHALKQQLLEMTHAT